MVDFLRRDGPEEMKKAQEKITKKKDVIIPLFFHIFLWKNCTEIPPEFIRKIQRVITG